MHELDDIALLRQYSDQNSEEAFATLVTRHIDKVYSIALRHTGNPHQAEEITQAVFVILARKSSQLSKHVILEGWLYETARLTAMTLIRSEVRRARREQEAYMQNVLNENETDVCDVWPQIAPLLDSGLAGLNETDRHAVVLRFFYGKSMGEIGTALGGSEDTARMRINRALEKLRKFFTKRGVSSTTAIIAGTISANSVQAAPVTLAKTVTAAAIAKGAAASGSTLTLIKGALKVMAWSKAKTAIVAGVVVLLAAGTTTVVVVKTHTAINQRDSIAAQAGVMKESVFQAMMFFAKEHQDEIPKSMADLKPYLPASAEGTDDDHWQISATGKLTPLLTRGDVILVEQRNVLQGKKKIILYTDGHVERK